MFRLASNSHKLIVQAIRPNFLSLSRFLLQLQGRVKVSSLLFFIWKTCFRRKRRWRTLFYLYVFHVGIFQWSPKLLVGKLTLVVSNQWTVNSFFSSSPRVFEWTPALYYWCVILSQIINNPDQLTSKPIVPIWAFKLEWIYVAELDSLLA